MYTHSYLYTHSVDGASVLEVPDDVSSSDASFLPSVVSNVNISFYFIHSLYVQYHTCLYMLFVFCTCCYNYMQETAVSLVMRGRPMLGEQVAVVGAGLIGLLTAMVLDTMGFDVCMIDIRDDRLHTARGLIPTITTYNPKSKVYTPSITIPSSVLAPFDVVFELSGVIPGLQTAVDLTIPNGRVILGSLYGEKAAPIKLGESTSLHMPIRTCALYLIANAI